MQNKSRKPQSRRARVAIAAATLLAVPAVVFGISSGQDHAEASVCLGEDNRQAVKKPAGSHYSPYFTTTSKCADINLAIAFGEPRRQVKVCFVNGGCQSSYKIASVSRSEIATNVMDGTKYRFYFASSSPEINAWVYD